MTVRRWTVLAGVAWSVLAPGPSMVSASDEADDLVPGRVLLIRSGKVVRFVFKGAFNLPNGGNAPTVEGASLRVQEAANEGNGITLDLPASGWSGLGRPPGTTGFRYRAGSADDPCRRVVVKPSVIRGVCKGSAIDITTPAGPIQVVLTLGTDSKRYCAECGGTEVRNIETVLLRKSCPPPMSCPPPCCNDTRFVRFRNVDASGDCGDVLVANGMPFSTHPDVACTGLYTGGGGNSVALPVKVPDLGEGLLRIEGCAGQTASLAPATAAETGSDRTCTTAGCFFGAPLPIPNPGSSPTSVCAIVRMSQSEPEGTLDCRTGDMEVQFTLDKYVHLTGDQATDPSDTIPGIQPCPLCSAGTCIGGPNNGMACTPGSSALGPAFPTSHDCPPDPMSLAGTISLLEPRVGVTTGTVTWTAVPSGGQDRAFCGFCRDADGSGAFENPPRLCLHNGMAEGAPCSGTYEACQQRNQGAFGPTGGTVKTITVVGTPTAGLLDGPAAGTLASVFCVPPTFDSTIDGAGDLPGPGALAVPGVLTLCSDAMSCP